MLNFGVTSFYIYTQTYCVHHYSLISTRVYILLKMPSGSNPNISILAIFVIAVLLAWPPATPTVHGQVEICAKGCNNLLLSCMSWCSGGSESATELQELRELEQCVKRCNKSFDGCMKWCNQQTRLFSVPNL
ncbi:hypothetical protein RchiOBHm_Chr4g0428631 [Rosa chinensis]|uniref:Uncharacterized protein n=1 Tax=Rosa chinensis TaxID=74649 RepID=A0A2P6R044_ROSCH|nr:hypothetical protein RchiOBHm_Chr4g0428631 [Rosa chinensis]